MEVTFGSASRSQSVVRLGRNKVSTYLAKRQSIWSELWQHHIVQKNINIQALLKRYHALTIYHQIPNFYSYYFILHLSHATQSNIEAILSTQIQHLKQKSTPYFTIQHSIQARQLCIHQLSRSLESLFNNADEQSVIKQLQDKIKHYRQLTIYAIDHITKWKQQLIQISPQKQSLYYEYKGYNYLMTLINDNNFIFKSFLAANVKFADKNDPFIMKPSIDGGAHQYAQIFNMTEEQRQKYITYMNYLSQQKIKANKRSQDQRQTKIKQIENIYHSKNINLNSLILYKKLNLHKPNDDLNQYQHKINHKLNQMQIKTDRINQIKASFTKTLIANPITQHHPQQLTHHQTNKSLSIKKIRLNLKKEFNQNNTDFDQLTRQKQLQLLKNKPFKIKNIKPVTIDPLPTQTLIQRQSFVIKPKLNTFQVIPKKIKIEQQLSNQPEENKINHSPESIFNHNQQVIVQLRNKVIKEISIQKQQKQRLEKQRRQYDRSIEQFIKRKINMQDLKDIKIKKQQKIVGKQQLAQQFNSKILFGYKEIEKSKLNDIQSIQQQLKKQMQLKWLRDVQVQLKRNQQLQKFQKAKNIQSNKLSKQYQQAIKKQQLQNKYQMYQRQEKAKIKQKQLQLDQMRKKEIQNQMRQIIEKQKEKLQKFTIIQKLSIEQQMRSAMKVKILQNLKQQKIKYVNQMKKQEAILKMEEQYRQQVKNKLQKQYNIKQRLDKIKKQQQKEKKLKAITQKLDYIDSKMQEMKQSQEKFNTNHLQSMKSRIQQFPDLRQSVFHKNPKYQQQKKQMRDQFQFQLFAFRKPQLYHPQGQFLVKNFQSQLNNQEFLNKKISNLKKSQLNIDKEQLIEKSKILDIQQKQQQIRNKQQELIKQKSQESSAFVRLSETSHNRKAKIQEFNAVHSKLGYEQIDQEHRIKLGMGVQQYQIYMKKKQLLDIKRNPDYQLQKQRFISKLIPQKKIQDFQIMDLNNKKQLQNQEKQFSQENILKLEEQQSQKSFQISFVKRQKQQKNQSLFKKTTQQNYIIDQTNKSIYSFSPSKRFLIVDDDLDNDFIISPQRKKKKHTQNKKSDSKKALIQQKQQKIQVKQNITKLRQVSFLQIEQFIQDHWKNLPKSIRKTSIFKKQPLLKFILNKKSVQVIEVVKNSQSVGLCFVVFNQTKTVIRSFDIIHLGPYNQDDYFTLLQNSTSFIFQNDPCEQITLSNCYDKQVNQQYNFILKFQKLFDSIGSIFQKKVINTQFQRKYVLRRLPGSQSQKIKQSVNFGGIKFCNNLIRTNKSIQNIINCQDNNNTTGYYSLLGWQLSRWKQLQDFNKVIEDTSTSKTLKYLSKISKSIKQSDIKCLKQIRIQKYTTFFQLNLQQMKKNKQIMKVDPNAIQQQFQIEWIQLQQNIQIKYSYILTQHKIRYFQDDYQLKYLKYKLEKETKSFSIQSSVFSTTVTILPTINPNFRIFILDSQQFQVINKQNSTSLDVYMKVFFNNLSKHTICSWQHIYIPQFICNSIFNIGEATFFNQNILYRQNVNFTYTNYLKNSIVSKPTHRDLLITPPFIIGIMNVQLQQISEGSPLYVKRVGFEDLYDKKIVKIDKNQDDD